MRTSSAANRRGGVEPTNSAPTGRSPTNNGTAIALLCRAMGDSLVGHAE